MTPTPKNITTFSGASVKKISPIISASVCVIAKWEEQYLVEWIEHYKHLGFNNVIFYDNNDVNNDGQYKVLKPYIDNGFVIYHDWKNIDLENNIVQRKSYENCIEEYKNKFEWIAFFDADEFLDLGEYKTISDFLKSSENFKNYDGIAIEWEIYDDNDNVINDGRRVKERFTRPIKRENIQIKNILNMLRCEKSVKSVHTISAKTLCNYRGESVHVLNTKIPTNGTSKIKLKHYKYKTIEEFLKKIERGDINGRMGLEKKENYHKRLNHFLTSFFGPNKLTSEKLQYIYKTYGPVEKYNKLLQLYEKQNISECKIWAWCKFDDNNVLIKRNWGDELNFNFLPQLFQNIKFDIFYSKDREKNIIPYKMIGSFLKSIDNSIIWGGGIKDKLPEHIDNVKLLCVRGPITRSHFINHGIECPKKYGDPSLLLPFVYNPQKEKQYDFGIIPHHSNVGNKIVHEFLCELEKKGFKVKYIKVKEYDKWTDVIDDIVSCNYILSESLYGLITSEAYGVPSKYIVFTGRNNIEVKDFYKSINKPFKMINYKDKNMPDIDIEINELKNYTQSKELIKRIKDLYTTAPFVFPKEIDEKIKKSYKQI
jgi:pyruvyltransferase